MIRVAASVGLRPGEFYDLTWREFELYCEGYQEQIDRQIDLLAWTQANLINVHIPKGKSRVKAEQLRPKRKRPQDGDDSPEGGLDMDEVRSFNEGVNAKADKSGRDQDGTKPADSPKEQARAAVEDAKARARARQDDQDSSEFWSTQQGRDLQAFIDGG